MTEDYAKIEVAQFTGNVVSFRKDTFLGTTDEPIDGDIVADLNEAKRGVTCVIIHESASVPNFPVNFELRSGSYVVGQINYINCLFVNSGKVIYTII